MRVTLHWWFGHALKCHWTNTGDCHASRYIDGSLWQPARLVNAGLCWGFMFAWAVSGLYVWNNSSVATRTCLFLSCNSVDSRRWHRRHDMLMKNDRRGLALADISHWNNRVGPASMNLSVPLYAYMYANYWTPCLYTVTECSCRVSTCIGPTSMNFCKCISLTLFSFSKLLLQICDAR